MLIGILSIFIHQGNAQNRDTTSKMARNTIHLNLLGGRATVSLMYGKTFLRKKHFFLTGEAGLGYYREYEFCILLLDVWHNWLQNTALAKQKI